MRTAYIFLNVIDQKVEANIGVSDSSEPPWYQIDYEEKEV